MGESVTQKYHIKCYIIISQYIKYINHHGFLSLKVRYMRFEVRGIIYLDNKPPVQLFRHSNVKYHVILAFETNLYITITPQNKLSILHQELETLSRL